MKIISTLVCAGLILSTSVLVKAQANKWKELTLTNQSQYQSKGVTVQIFKETYSGLEGQQYTVKFTNITTQKLKITGTLSARTYCGNALSTNIDVTIKPGQSLGGNDYLMDNVGLTGTVHTEDCKTDKIYPNPNDKNTYKYDRISSLGLIAMAITPIVEDNAQAAYAPKKAASALDRPSAAQQNNTAGRTYTGAANAGSTGTSTANTYQQQAQQNIQNAQQGINGALDQLKDALQQNMARKQEEAQQKQALADQEEKDRREREAQRLADETKALNDERDESNRNRAVLRNQVQQEINLNRNIATTYFGRYVKPRDADVNYPNLKTIYYVAFCRVDNDVTLMPPLPIEKYSDDTWLTESQLSIKIGSLFKPGSTMQVLSSGNENLEYNRLNIIGYFTNPAEANAAYGLIKTNAAREGRTVSIINTGLQINPAKPGAKTPAKPATKDNFWNN